MPRGGKRNGVAGKAYANRTDLGGQNVVQPSVPTPGKLAVQASTGQAYGAAGEQKQSQRILPMASVPQSTTPSDPSTAQPEQNPLTSMFAPTQMPNQPVTAGVNNSPGPGAEALGLDNPMALQYQTAKSQVLQLASNPDAGPALQYLAQRISEAY